MSGLFEERPQELRESDPPQNERGEPNRFWQRPNSPLVVLQQVAPAITPATVVETPEPTRLGGCEERPATISKKALDALLVVLVLPIAGPILLMAAFWVRLVSGGNVLFVQKRVGCGGRYFRCFKLRTMKKDSKAMVHEQHITKVFKEDKPMDKLDTVDPRLIPGARLLRALGIDELPQLLNVVRGEMSVIGPRPCIPYEAEHYQPWQRERFAVPPGLTGLWQVRGKNKTTFSQMVTLDIEYVRRQSLWLDVKILFATPKALMVQLVTALWKRARPTR